MDEYVQVILSTDSKNYSVPSFPISVSTSSTSVELNKLVKGLLEESHGSLSSTEFVFLIQNEYITSSIADHLSKKQISSELLEIQYCEKQRAPSFSNEIVQDDLISSVRRLGNYVLTGSYDGTVQLWTITDPKRLFSVELEDKVKCVDWLLFDNDVKHEAAFVTGGFDQSARIWTWDMTTNDVTCVAVCRGHSETVMTVAAPTLSQNSNGLGLFATGSWDGTIKIWSASTMDTDLSKENGGIAHKRKSKTEAPTRVPYLTLAGHRETVTRVCWLPASNKATSDNVLSVSWDHSIRLWDCHVATTPKSAGGAEVRSIVASHAIHDADASTQGILTASSDNRVRIYDLRAQDALSLVGFHGHTAWLTSVAWAPHVAYQFVTGSIDRTVRIWDSRNPKACLFNLMGHTDIVTDVDWTLPLRRDTTDYDVMPGNHLILSSSADGTVKMYNFPH